MAAAMMRMKHLNIARTAASDRENTMYSRGYPLLSIAALKNLVNQGLESCRL